MNAIDAVLIPVDGAAQQITLIDDDELETLKALVGECIDAVYSPSWSVTIWTNERRVGLINTRATVWWWVLCPAAVGVGFLFGPCVMTGGPRADGETLGVPAGLAKMITGR